MHSFRLRYIVLGLLIYIQSAFCRTCGSKFDDVASRAVQANVVFHGIVHRVDAVKDASVDAASRAGTGYYTATFRVIRFRKKKLLKGSLPKETERRYKLVTVGIFGPDDKEKCITQVKVGSQYIVFLNSTVRTSASAADSPSFRTISGFPEPLSRKTARQVQRTLCKNCARAPMTRVIPRDVGVHKGKRLKLRCKSQGRPRPRITWFKEGVRLRNGKHYRIRNSRHKSVLQVKMADMEDAGVYQCHAVNIVNRTVAIANVRVRKAKEIGERNEEVDRRGIRSHHRKSKRKPHKDDGTTVAPPAIGSPEVGNPPAHAVLCPQQAYCLNRGTCYMLKELGTKFCKCQPDFIGHRCETKSIFDVVRELESRNAHTIDRTMTLLGLAIGALTLLVICGIAFFLARTKRSNFRKTQELIRRLQEPCTNGTFRPLLDNDKSNPPKDGILTRKPVMLRIARNASTQTERRPLSSVFNLQRPHNGHVLSSRSNLPRQNTVPASFSPQEVGRSRLNAVSSSPECQRAINNVTVNAIMEADSSTLAACNQSIPDPEERGVPPPFISNKRGGLLGLGAGKRSESLDLAPGRLNGLLHSAGGKRSISLDLAPAKHAGDGDSVECKNALTSDPDMLVTDSIPAIISRDDSADDVAMAIGGSEATGEEEDELIEADSNSDSSIGEEQLLFEKLRANPRVSLGEQGNIKEQGDPWEEQESSAQQGNDQQPGNPRQWDGEPPLWGGQSGTALSLFGNDLFSDITDLTIGEESDKPLLSGGASDENNRTLPPPYPEMYDPDPDATPV